MHDHNKSSIANLFPNNRQYLFILVNQVSDLQLQKKCEVGLKQSTRLLESPIANLFPNQPTVFIRY